MIKLLLHITLLGAQHVLPTRQLPSNRGSCGATHLSARFIERNRNSAWLVLRGASMHNSTSILWAANTGSTPNGIIMQRGVKDKQTIQPPTHPFYTIKHPRQCRPSPWVYKQ